jgi:hypothetical protein
MFELDDETKKIMKVFKTIKEKQVVANRLATLTVKIGLEEQSDVLKHYYNDYEAHYIATAIELGLLNLIGEDFYIIKKILGYKIVLSFLI